MTGFTSSDGWLSVSDAAERLGVRRNAVHDWIGAGHLQAEEAFRDGRGIHYRIPAREVDRLARRRCRLPGCAKPAPSPSECCCGAHVRALEMTGKPRSKLRKHPEHEAPVPREPRCEGEGCGVKLGRVRPYQLAEGRGRLCRSCAQSERQDRRRQGEPDEGYQRWLEGTRAYRASVAGEVKRRQGEGWLTTADVAKRRRVKLVPTVIATHVRLGHLAATPHAMSDGRLVTVHPESGANPVWLLFREDDVAAFERWLEGGDWRRQQHRDPEWRVVWAKSRHPGRSATAGRLAAQITAARGAPHGRAASDGSVREEQRAEILELATTGLYQKEIAQQLGLSRDQVKRVLASR